MYFINNPSCRNNIRKSKLALFGGNCEVQKVNRWGKRRLAYEINKSKSGRTN